MQKLKVAIYVRVSGKKQEEKNQLPDCRKLAKELKFKGYDIIKEKLSAFKNPDRETLRKLEKYDHVVIWRYDRLQRNRKRFVELMRYYSHRGTKIHSFSEGWVEELHKIPSPWNEMIYDFVIQLVGWMAEEESMLKSRRVKLAVKKKKGRTFSYRGKKWGRKTKKVSLKRLKECYDTSLRKTAERYNHGLKEEHKISHMTVKKLLPLIHEGGNSQKGM